MQGPGGGQKINLMKEFLNSPPPSVLRDGSDPSEGWHTDDLILFSDGYDSTVHGTPADFIKKWQWFSADVVFGAESVNWPGQCKTQPPVSVGRFRYLNSGGYIGRATVLRDMFNSRSLADYEDDQLYCQELYAAATTAGKWNVKLGKGARPP
jgi:hypothetical protein